VIVTASADETGAAGARLAASLRGGDVVHLVGDLGVGKTHFVKGLAMGLGLDPDSVCSPTFTFINVHRPADGRGLGLVHVDLYRIGGVSELVELGLEEIPGPLAIAAIEWADRLPAATPRACVVTITDLGGDERRIAISRA
jgi:tRNA threonylcarbamoyladenosine biosynthesis protein TsaE